MDSASAIASITSSDGFEAFRSIALKWLSDTPLTSLNLFKVMRRALRSWRTSPPKEGVGTLVDRGSALLRSDLDCGAVAMRVPPTIQERAGRSRLAALS